LSGQNLGLDPVVLNVDPWQLAAELVGPAPQVFAQRIPGCFPKWNLQWYLEDEAQRIYRREHFELFMHDIIAYSSKDAESHVLHPLQSPAG